MHILILGGTGFLGRHLTERALARGWRVTHFNRGKTNPGLYEGITELRGDRTRGLDALEGRSFDSVIDTSGYLPRDAEASATFLKPRAPHYVFVSSISAYAEGEGEEGGAITEKSALAPWDPGLDELDAVTPETYGALKAECERRVQKVYGDGALIIRPGLIVGRYDPTGRFSYWPQRFRKGGKIVVPARTYAPVQIIDAYDLAAWTLDLCGKRAGGVFNGTGPARAFTLGELFDALMPLAPEGTELVPLSDEVLLEHKVTPWTGLPLWLPESANADRMMCADLAKPLAAGLTLRPLKETVADILGEIDETGAFAAGTSLTEDQERQILAAL